MEWFKYHSSYISKKKRKKRKTEIETTKNIINLFCYKSRYIIMNKMGKYSNVSVRLVGKQYMSKIYNCCENLKTIETDKRYFHKNDISFI